MWSTTKVTPYVGVCADYYFDYDDARLRVAPLLLPTEFAIANGSRLSVGGEVGELKPIIPNSNVVTEA